MATAAHQRGQHPVRAGRPTSPPVSRALIVRPAATEIITWGYRRIHGELAGRGYQIGASTVWTILSTAGIDPAPRRAGATRTRLLWAHAHASLACDLLRQARNLFMDLDDAGERFRFLSRDRDAKFTAARRGLHRDRREEHPDAGARRKTRMDTRSPLALAGAYLLWCLAYPYARCPWCRGVSTRGDGMGHYRVRWPAPCSPSPTWRRGSRHTGSGSHLRS